MSRTKEGGAVRRTLAMMIAMCLTCQSCASFHSGHLPSANIYDYPGRVTKNGVSVAVDAMNAERTKVVFDANLVGKGIQPLYIVISNNGDRVYHFSKSDIDRDYVPAERAAQAAYRNTIGRTIIWSVVALPFVVVGLIIWPLLGMVAVPITEGTRSSGINKDIRAMFINNEIGDTNIGPKSNVAGVMFVKPLGHRQLQVKLTDTETQQPLVFEFAI